MPALVQIVVAGGHHRLSVCGIVIGVAVATTTVVFYVCLAMSCKYLRTLTRRPNRAPINSNAVGWKVSARGCKPARPCSVEIEQRLYTWEYTSWVRTSCDAMSA